MNKKLSLTLAVALALLASASITANAMTKVEYKAEKSQISVNYKSAKAACESMAGNSKDVCVAQSKADEKVAKADLESRYTGKEKAQFKLQIAKAEATYSVSKEKCNASTGNVKDVCVKEAKAVEVKAKEDAKLYKAVKTETKDSIETRMNADYKVAIEKCDALAGDAKTACVNSAKTNFKKN